VSAGTRVAHQTKPSLKGRKSRQLLNMQAQNAAASMETWSRSTICFFPLVYLLASAAVERQYVIRPSLICTPNGLTYLLSSSVIQEL